MLVKGVPGLNVFNTLRPRQHGCHFVDDTFKRIFLNENVGISIKISLNFVHKGPINNIRALVQIMAWRRPGDKPLSEPMVGSLLTHICITRPQWVNCLLACVLHWKIMPLILNYFYNFFSKMLTINDSQLLKMKSMPQCKTAISPLLTHWIYCSLALNPLHWRHNEPDGVSNHQPPDCLLNCLFRCRSKKTSKLRVTDLCAENSPGTGEFSAQKASNAENVFIWWRHHASKYSSIFIRKFW